MEKEGDQTIRCSVNTCEHHDKNDYCMLNSIQVTPLTHDADTPEDSMCESFERKED